MFPSIEDDEKTNMGLSDQEVQWSHDVKAAALEDKSLTRLSDYEYAQHALFNNGNVEKSIFQIEGMQEFRKEYKINDTVEEGMAVVRQFHTQQDWMLLDLSYTEDCHVLVCDYAQLNPSALRLPEDWRIFLGGLYYSYQMVTSNLRSVREGLIILGEIEGLGWKNFSVELMKTYYEHFLRYYPVKIQGTHWMSNSVVGNIFNSLNKSILDERGQNIQIGVNYEAYDGRLDATFKVPTPEIARARLMDKCQTLLTKRFQHYQSYCLPPVAPALEEVDNLFREAMEAMPALDNEDGEAAPDNEEASVVQ